MVSINVALSNTASSFCSVSVLGAYALMVQRDPSIGSFDATTIFTILTTVQLIGYPLCELVTLSSIHILILLVNISNEYVPSYRVVESELKLAVQLDSSGGTNH